MHAEWETETRINPLGAGGGGGGGEEKAPQQTCKGQKIACGSQFSSILGIKLGFGGCSNVRFSNTMSWSLHVMSGLALILRGP